MMPAGPEDEQTRDVFAHFGAASYHCQHLEYSLKIAIYPPDRSRRREGATMSPTDADAKTVLEVGQGDPVVYRPLAAVRSLRDRSTPGALPALELELALVPLGDAEF